MITSKIILATGASFDVPYAVANLISQMGTRISELEKLRDSYGNIKAQLDKSTALVSSLTTELSQAKHTITALETTVQKQSQDLDITDAQLAGANVTIESVDRQHKQALEEIAKLKKNAYYDSKIIASKDKDIATLQSRLKASIKDMTGTEQTFQKEFDSLKSQVEDYHDLQAKFAELTHKYDELVAKQESSNKVYWDLQAKFDELDSKHATVINTLTKLLNDNENSDF